MAGADNTRFRLENGQVWRQNEAGYLYRPDKSRSNPEVTIRRSMFGSYLLKIDGFNSSVKVERVE
jgi:hypothetical protein